MTFDENIPLLVQLQSRVSHPRLGMPAPTTEQMAQCYKAAFRAPDHAWLRPWRFIECRGSELEQLGRLQVDAMRSESRDLPDTVVNKLLKGPQRAPLVVICYAHSVGHPKVPELEQLITTGCAINNMGISLSALGYGSVWRTGDIAYSKAVHTALNFKENEHIVGFLYIGTPLAEGKAIPELDQKDFVISLTQHLSS